MFPGQGLSIDNELIDHLLKTKKREIAKGCASYIPQGKDIDQLLDTLLINEREDGKVSVAIDNQKDSKEYIKELKRAKLMLLKSRITYES